MSRSKHEHSLGRESYTMHFPTTCNQTARGSISFGIWKVDCVIAVWQALRCFPNASSANNVIKKK